MTVRPSTVLATAVAVLACAGTTATAASLIDGGDVRNGSLTGADVRDRSLRGADIAAGTIPANRLTKAARASLRGRTGAPGAPGAPGAQGAQGPSGVAAVVTRTGTASFDTDGIIGQTKEATAQCAEGEKLVGGGVFAPTATVDGRANFVVTGQVPVLANGTVATSGQTGTGWKVTVVRGDDLIGLVTAYALCAQG